MLSHNNLHRYQLTAIDFIVRKKRCALWLDMGLGKTSLTLTAAVHLLDTFSIAKVLVVAPLRVANTVWKQEALKWEHLHHLKISVCTGSERERTKSLLSTADVYVINRENLNWLVMYYKKKWPFDMVVIDESGSFKNPAAQRFKALKKVLPYTTHMVLLTGTPSPNGLLDLWSQIYLIDFGETLGRTFTAYKQRFFDQDYMGYRFTPKTGADENIHELLGDMAMSMSAEDYLELPERIELFEKIDLSAEVLTGYKKFENNLLLSLPDDEEIEAVNAAVLANKLLQYANGAMYKDEFGNWATIHDEKLTALSELVEVNDEPMLVAYNYKSDLHRLRQKFPQAVVLDKDPLTVELWNQGRIPMLLAHPASAGHGLNLQQGGSLCVWFSMCWSLENYQQFNARLHRQGQQKPVRIVHLIAKGTIDERVVSVLAEKDSCQANLLRALKNT